MWIKVKVSTSLTRTNAFIYGDLDHVIHMEQPTGFERKDHPSYVCKLKKSLYGLKQSGLANLLNFRAQWFYDDSC